MRLLQLLDLVLDVVHVVRAFELARQGQLPKRQEVIIDVSPPQSRRR